MTAMNFPLFRLAALMLVAIAPAFAQTAAPSNQPAISIRGTVSAANGDTIPGVRVVLEEKTRSESVETKTNYDGRFSFSGLKAGTYVVRAKHKGFPDAATHPMELSAGESKEVDLVLESKPVYHPLPPGPVTSTPSVAQAGAPQNRPAIFIKGTVRDFAGAPIPDSVVTLEEKKRAESLEAKTGKDGTFSFLAMKAGTYVVRVKRIGFRGAFTEAMDLSPGQSKKINFVLKVVTDADPSPPPERQPSSPGAKSDSVGVAVPLPGEVPCSRLGRRCV